jgi:hypothetical protein
MAGPESLIRTEGEKIESTLIPLIVELESTREVLKKLEKDELGLATFLLKAIDAMGASEGMNDLKPKQILEAIEFATKAEKERAIAEAQESVGKETEAVDNELIEKSEKILKALNRALNQVAEKEKLKTGFEKVMLENGMEVMLSRQISEPLNYEKAVMWCTNEGGRVPTIEELEALYKKTEEDSEEGKILRKSFDGLVFWSSTFDKTTNSRKVFDFKDGRVEIRSNSEELHVARAVA